MRRRPPTPEHVEAVSRRLATLSAELASVRGDPVVGHQHTRIRQEAVAESLPWDDAAEVPVVPVPGRHASRRLADRVRLTHAHLAVVAVVVALGVGITAWLAVRSQAEPVPVAPLTPVSEPLADVPAVDGSAAAAGSGVTSTGSSAVESATSGGVADSTAEDLTVDVAGKVRRPGIAVLPPGSRVVDALEAAGGARRGVDLTSLNLARPLVDGEQILVGVTAPAGVPATVGDPGSATTAGALVNLNTADPPTLETLPGVGPVTAGAIISWRDQHGGFSAVEELLEVDGIGDATLAQIAPHVTI
ncbi:ComEA family DNA-binding protein [Nocardioides terrigena]|uniref:ComEA family DNA-binding protein n=1 Tax=Nocardioides terrigena TaxID=424797 RepID=UPI000D31DD1F|nr:ComEA family DNA-binding protein [Nocardioides terrigena]